MNYCNACGSVVSLRVPPGDNLPRYVCDTCGVIHYQNPRIVAGCLPEWDGRLLLCRRAIEPRYGLWTLPAGFMENGETVQVAAARETLEEAGARMTDLSLFGVFNLPHINQVYMMFRGQVVDGLSQPGAESLEVGYYTEAEIPWDDLAFPVITETLQLYYADTHKGRFDLHIGDLIREADRSLRIVRY